jgi:hypothetical protein
LRSPSPFNIAESLTLFNFTRDGIAALYGRHSEATGQAFEPEAVDRAWRWTEGQPWLVNALAKQAVERDLKNDFSKPVTAALIDGAAESLMRTPPTRIGSLLDKLTEPRVARVIEPMLTGGKLSAGALNDDIQLCKDLGLVKANAAGTLVPANPIYADVIARFLNGRFQLGMPEDYAGRWMDGRRLDMNGLLKEFQKYWSLNADALTDKGAYKEAKPHLYLQAFLQRVANGGAHIGREFALGRKRADLLIEYAGLSYPIEVKLADRNKKDALEQIAGYMDRCGAKEGWLVVFDRDPRKPWKEKLYWETEKLPVGGVVHRVGC